MYIQNCGKPVFRLANFLNISGKNKSVIIGVPELRRPDIIFYNEYEIKYF